MGNDATISVAGRDERQEIMQQGHDTNGSTSVDSARMCTGERCIDREEGFASQFYSTCLQGFQQLCRQEQAVYAPGPRSYLLKEELGELYLWGESFSPGELDKALDEYEDIRDNVLDLLVDLGELVIRGKTSRERRYLESHVSPSSNRTLKSSVALRASSTVAHAGQIHELESSVERARFISSDVDGQEDLDVLPVDTKCLDRDDHSDDDMADFCEDAAFTIHCLTELGPSLQQNLASARKPAPPVSQSAFGLLCPSGPAGFYVSLVRDKFKRASKGLVERLGEANWQRHVRVRNIMKDFENNPAKGQNTARSVFQPDTTFHDSGIGTSVPARTQYAPSHTSFQTSNPEGGPNSLRVPPAPIEAADGKSFQCYLCGDMLSTIRTRTQWKMHVFSDLVPYLCTFDGCQHKLRSFQSRSSWADHEFQEHRLNKYWACPECSRKSCSILDWEHHLDDVHNLKFSGPDLVAARKNACHISPMRAEEEQCPLCQIVLGKPRRAFVKHVSRHMEDIALMALPSNAEEDSETDSIDTNLASAKDNHTSKDCFGDDNGNTVYIERYDTDPGLIVGSPEVERRFLYSGSPDDSTPAERSPTPERMTMSKLRERRQRPKAQPSHGDAVLIGYPGGLHPPDLALTAGKQPLPVESGGVWAEDDVDLKDGRDASEWFLTGTSASEYQYDPVDSKSPEAPHLGTSNCVDPFVQQAGVSVDKKSQGQSPQEPVKKTREKRMLTPSQRKQTAATRKVGACSDCRRRKKRCTHGLPGDSMDRKTNTETPPSLTSSKVPIKDPRPQISQTDKSTWGSIYPTELIEVDPSQFSLGETIGDRRDRLPPVPLFQPAVPDLPPDDAPDQSNSPQPVDEVRRRREPAMVDNENRDFTYEALNTWWSNMMSG